MTPPSPGTRIGSYEIVSFPIIQDLCLEYHCLDHARERPALLIAAHPELLLSQSIPKKLLTIGETWKDLGAHPHIVPCLDVIQTENQGPFLALPAVVPDKGHQTAFLAEWLRPGQPLPVLQALLFGIQIARGMRHISSKLPGFVHGDIKPKNILVGGGRILQADMNRLRVTGIGLSDLLRSDDPAVEAFRKSEPPDMGRIHRIQGSVGTPLFMAPELWRNERAGTPTDMYSLGCVLYIMLVGRYPVVGETVDALRQNHCTGNVRPIPGSLPEAARTLVARCLDIDPGSRYPAWEQLEVAIADAYKDVVGQPVPAAESADELTSSERDLEGWFLDSLGNTALDVGASTGSFDCFELARKVGASQGDKKLESSAINNEGVALLRRGDARGAMVCHEKALEMARQVGDRSIEGAAKSNLANALLVLGDPRKAIECLEQALALVRESGDREHEMGVLGNLGTVYHELGDIRRSTELFEQQLEIARRIGDRHGEGVALGNLGTNHSVLGDDRRAIKYAEQSLAIRTELGDRHGRMTDLTNLGNYFRNLGEPRRAFEHYAKALEITRALGDQRGEASVLDNMGSAYSSQGETVEALKHFEQALKVFREIGELREQGDCLTNMGVAYIQQAEIEPALSCWRQALEIDRQFGDKLGLAIDAFNLAKLLAQEQRFAEALPFAEEAAQNMEQIGHPVKAPEARELAENIKAQLDPRTAGKIDFSNPEPPDTRQQIERTRKDNPQLTAKMSDGDILDLLRQADQATENDRPTAFISFPPKREEPPIRDSDLHKMSMNELIEQAHEFIFKGSMDAGEKIIRLLDARAEQTNDLFSRSSALMLQGEVCALRGDYRRSLDLLGGALEPVKHSNNHKLLALIYNSFGVTHLWAGDYAQAVKWFGLAVHVSRKAGNEQLEVFYKLNLGIAHFNLNNPAKAEELFREALDSAVRSGNEKNIPGIYAKLARILWVRKDFAAAFRTGLKAFYLSRRIGEADPAAEACDVLGLIRIDQGKPARAVRKYQTAAAYYLQSGRERSAADDYAGIAALYTKMSEPMLAFLNYDKALAYYQRAGAWSDIAKIRYNMGLLYREQGKLTQAREEFEKSEEAFRSAGEMENAEKAGRTGDVNS
jgi:tetratricopeptide (TPR) repeat protein